MDLLPFNPLDQLHSRHRRLYRGRLHHPPMHFSLCTPHLPSLRRLPIRRQRFLPFLPRRRRHHVLPCPLFPLGRRQGRESAGQFDLCLRRRGLGLVFRRGEVEGEE